MPSRPIYELGDDLGPRLVTYRLRRDGRDLTIVGFRYPTSAEDSVGFEIVHAYRGLLDTPTGNVLTLATEKYSPVILGRLADKRGAARRDIEPSATIALERARQDSSPEAVALWGFLNGINRLVGEDGTLDRKFEPTVTHFVTSLAASVGWHDDAPTVFSRLASLPDAAAVGLPIDLERLFASRLYRDRLGEAIAAAPGPLDTNRFAAALNDAREELIIENLLALWHETTDDVFTALGLHHALVVRAAFLKSGFESRDDVFTNYVETLRPLVAKVRLGLPLTSEESDTLRLGQTAFDVADDPRSDACLFLAMAISNAATGIGPDTPESVVGEFNDLAIKTLTPQES